MRLEGKVAVITGAGSGIGRATAMRFLREGARVIAADINEAAGRETVELARHAGLADGIRFLTVDVSYERDVESAIGLAMSDFGRLDCVFNNAGIGGAFGSVMRTSVEDWDATFAVLVRGVFLGVKHGARAMVDAGIQGALINTASVAGFSGGEAPMAYSSAKAAVINLTRAAAFELARHRIRVNCICPAGVDTPMLRRGFPQVRDSENASLQPWPEPGRPEDVTGAALYFASNDSGFVTGAILPVDGGLSASGASLSDRVAVRRGEATGMDFGTTRSCEGSATSE